MALSLCFSLFSSHHTIQYFDFQLLFKVLQDKSLSYTLTSWIHVIKSLSSNFATYTVISLDDHLSIDIQLLAMAGMELGKIWSRKKSSKRVSCYQIYSKINRCVLIH
jgi:hypothetical protein